MADLPEESDPTGEDSSLVLEAMARYKEAKDHASKWIEQAKECYRFYADDQWSADDLRKLEEQQRPVVTFNRTKRLVNAVVGHEMNNRAETRYIPRTQGDAKVNEELTKAGAYFRDQCDGEFEQSDAFRDTLICGMGWTQSRLSDATNPDFDLIEERVDPLEMLWDPAAKKPNLADGRFQFRRKRYTAKEIRTIWPDFKGPFADAFEDDYEDGIGGLHETNPRNSYQRDGERSDVKPDVLVVEYQYKEREAYYVISHLNPESGETTSFDLSADDMTDELKKKLDASTNARMTLKRRTVVRRCFFIGKQIVQGPDVVCPKDFTYQCITGYRDRERNHWHGIVHALRDPQRWSNKWLSQMMHILNSNAKGGVMLEEDAIPADSSKDAFENSWADPAALTWLGSGALKDGRVMPKPPPTYPSGVDKLLEYANQSFTDVSGVNQELLGLADREQAGVLEWQRKQSAVTLLAPLFDSLRRFRKMQGRVWLYMMQKYVADGRIIRITQDTQDGREQEVNIPFGWSADDTAEYDVIVDQAQSAPNQKEQTWAVLMQLFPVLKDGLPPPILMKALEYSPLPESFISEMKEMMAEEAQKPPPPDPEVMKAQAQIEMKKAELQIKQQEAQLNMAVEQQKAQMQLEIERAKMALEMEKANMQMSIERQKADQSMALAQQKASFDAQRLQQDAMLDAQRAQFDMQREDVAFERQNERDDMASQAKIKREDQAARAKARRQPKQDGAQT